MPPPPGVIGCDAVYTLTAGLPFTQLIQVFDSWAGELTPACFKKFSGPYLQYISENLPKKLKSMNLDPVPMIVFPKGAWYSLDAVCDMGYNVVGLDWLHDPAETVKVIGARPMVVQGNADPGVLYGSHAAITEAVEDMFKGFDFKNRKKGWICNLGHGKSD
jgi:uroporphyrinogen decarboxylase